LCSNHPKNLSAEAAVRVATLLNGYSMRYVADLTGRHRSSQVAWSDDLTRQELTYEGQGMDENIVPI
jgi:hypothetical protein